MAAPYIPPKEADLANWSQNFADLIEASPATYDLSAADAAAITAANDTWQDAYANAINPATRTTPAVAAKNSAKLAFINLARTYAVQIAANPGVSNTDKLNLGLNLPNHTPSPVPAPTSFPELMFVGATPLLHTLRFTDSMQPTGKGKKPFGAIAAQVFRLVATAPGSDPSAAPLLGTFTKNPFASTFNSGDVGQVATYWARYVTRTGLVGPWSPALSATVLGA
jgi:hypothetical protein